MSAEQISGDRLTDLPAADVVILGELHDNPIHHINQAVAVAALAPRAIVFEMLTPAQAARVTPDLRADAEALGKALGWEEAGWPDFALYHPIFIAAPEALIFGAAFPREEVRRAVSDGAAAVFGPEAAGYGLDRPLSPGEQAEREAEQMAAHCDALPAGLLPGMVEAQRLRDAGLARSIVEALGTTGGPVAVITGNGHARRDWGVPVYLSAVMPAARILSVGQLEEAPEDDPPFDLWLITAPAERDDPCAVFR